MKYDKGKPEKLIVDSKLKVKNKCIFGEKTSRY